MNPTVKNVTDATERKPLPAEDEGLRLAKQTHIKLLEYALNHRMLQKPVKVLDIKGPNTLTGITTVLVKELDVEGGKK